MSEDNVDALKKGLADIWAALSSCSYGDISETMMTVSRAKAKCLALIDPKLLEMENDTLWWTLFGDAGVARMILGKKDHPIDPAVRLVVEVESETGLKLNEKQRKAVIEIIQKELSGGSQMSKRTDPSGSPTTG